MFRNRAIQMRLVRTSDSTPMEMPEMPHIEMPSKEDVIAVTDEIIKKSALGVIAVIAAAALAHTASEIAIDRFTN